MGKNFTAAFAVCLLISSLPLACGDDEEPGGTGGKGGKGGSGGSSGNAGSSTGGKAGSGGATTGGASGAGGRGGTAGQGGTAGSAGTAGTDGGMGGADGGMGGEGGAPGPMTFTCEELCAHVATAASCSDNTMCDVEICPFSLGPACDDEAQALIDCLGNGPDSNFSCMTNKPIYDYGTGTCDAEFDASLLCEP